MGRRLRALSGWNVFQKEQMAGQVLQPDQYKAKLAQVSRAWRDLSVHEKDTYKIEAAHQQTLREQLATTPLLSKAEDTAQQEAQERPGETQLHKTNELEQQVGRSACKKLSARRFGLNTALQKEHPLWTSRTQFAD